MLTQDQIDGWGGSDDSGAPDPAKPFIICPHGTGATHKVLDFDPGQHRIWAVVRVRDQGAILKDRVPAFKWFDRKKGVEGQGHHVVLTMSMLPRVGFFPSGDWLFATDYRMIADPRTKVSRTFGKSGQLHRFCLSATWPHPWAAVNVLSALGNRDKLLQAATMRHQRRLLSGTAPNGTPLFSEPDDHARRDILDRFNEFTDHTRQQ